MRQRVGGEGSRTICGFLRALEDSAPDQSASPSVALDCEMPAIATVTRIEDAAMEVML